MTVAISCDTDPSSPADTIKPTSCSDFFGGITIATFGLRFGDFSGLWKNHTARGILTTWITEKFSGRDICVFSPNTSGFNAKICRPDDFLNSQSEPFSNSVRRVSYSHWFKADGVVLDKPGQAVCIRSADCPTVVIRHLLSGRTVVCHAGRDSLLDKAMYLGGQSRWPESSVIDSAMASFSQEERDSPEMFRVVMVCGISWHTFSHTYSHPVYGEQNRRMISFVRRQYGASCVPADPPNDNRPFPSYAAGRLDLFEIVVAQCSYYGIVDDQIFSDKICTCRQNLAVAGRGTPDYWSLRRFQREMIIWQKGDKKNPPPIRGQNAVLVVYDR